MIQINKKNVRLKEKEKIANNLRVKSKEERKTANKLKLNTLVCLNKGEGKGINNIK